MKIISSRIPSHPVLAAILLPSIGNAELILRFTCVAIQLLATLAAVMAVSEGRPPGKPMYPILADLRYVSQMQQHHRLACDAVCSRNRLSGLSDLKEWRSCCVTKAGWDPSAPPSTRLLDNSLGGNKIYRMTPDAQIADPFFRQAPGVDFSPPFMTPFPLIVVPAMAPVALPPQFTTRFDPNSQNYTVPSPPPPPAAPNATWSQPPTC